MHTKQSAALQGHIKQGISKALKKFLSIEPEERIKLEKTGVNLSNFVFDELYSYVVNIKAKDILIVMDQGIGNMVMLTPALKTLRHLNPRLNITVFCKEPAAEVIRGWDVVDRVITTLDNTFYDLAYFTIWSRDIGNRWGNDIQQHSKAIFESKLRTFHEAVQNCSVCEFLDGYVELPEPHCETASEEDSLRLLPLFKKTATEKYIVFGDTTLRGFGWDAKRWLYYPELAKLIKKKLPEHKIILIGDAQDKKDYEEQDWPDNVTLDFCGAINIPQLATVIQGAEFYVGNDTGPTHISAAVGTKTFAIFGPTLLSKNKPLGRDVTIIKVNRPCSPCQYTDKFNECDCIESISANEVYNEIFFPENNMEKKKVLLVGAFGGGALRNETHIKKRLEKKFKLKVIPFDYRESMNKTSNPNDTTYELLNTAINKEVDYVFINGGQQLGTEIIALFAMLAPKVKVINWYVDNRKQIEPWFKELSSVCHSSYWSTGDPVLLSGVMSQTQKMCEFLPITPDHTAYFPTDVEKDIDVLFVGTPHSEDRLKLVDTLIQASKDQGFKLAIHGDGRWPDEMRPFVKPGIFGADFNDALNRSKIVVNQNIVNDVPLYFSDRYFYPMAVKSVGLNRKIPRLEEMFEDNKHMVTWESEEEVPARIKQLLADDKLRAKIGEEGYAEYMSKYKLDDMLEVIVKELQK
jgi:ADP-heptose:LPS heptosyltransferase/glycosyltransferase involved in cell wall biosynthesis